MVRCLQVILVFLLVACAAAPAIVQEKPQPNQCFEGPFNPYAVTAETWELFAADPPLFILKKKQGLPCAIIVLVAPSGQVVRYCYLDGGKLRSFYYSPEKDCYVEEQLPPELAAEGKKLLQKVCKELDCKTSL
jgi:hypothetical protein